jgi:hypothetical protein
MTWSNFWRDLWLTMRHGKWYVAQEKIPFSKQRAYFAYCRRSKDMVLCDSKREAEGVVAINNDSRGYEIGQDVRLP